MAQPQKQAIVVFATADGIWIDGQAVGFLVHGRVPLQTHASAFHDCPGLTKARLHQGLNRAVARRNPSAWNMKLNMSYAVSSGVVQLVLRTAGRFGIARMVVHRFMERP